MTGWGEKMLIINCGTSLEVGETTRNLYMEKGFEIIQKKCYEGENCLTTTWYGKRNLVSKEEVLECDLKYVVNGIITGFNKEQFIDAVRGRKNCLLSVTPDTFEFVEQIKRTHGDYVKVVYTFVTEEALSEMTREKKGMSEAEYLSRMKTGAEIRKFCSENMHFFDKVVIYTGENTAFDLQHLRIQHEAIIDAAVKEQEKQNEKMYVDLPYTGTEDYAFISYSHKDNNEVLPILSKLQRMGYRIWFDEGIKKGENWRIFIGEKVKNCKDFIVFTSKNSVDNENVLAEINGALMTKKKVLLISLDDSELDFGLQMYIKQRQDISYNAENFEKEIREGISESIKDKRL